MNKALFREDKKEVYLKKITREDIDEAVKEIACRLATMKGKDHPRGDYVKFIQDVSTLGEVGSTVNDVTSHHPFLHNRVREVVYARQQ